MVKKLFALASVTALTGLMAAVTASGCSSTETITDTPETGTGSDAKLDAPKKAETEPEEAGEKTCPPEGTVTAADIDKALTWLPPAPIQAVCTQQNIDDFKKLFTPGGDLTFVNIKKVLGTACSACAFSEKTATTWQLFANFDGTGAVDNVTGSCFAQNSAGGAACGKARFQWETCLDNVCTEDGCGSADKAAACKKAPAQNGPCKELTEAYTKACPDEAALINSCGTIFNSLVVSCAGGSDAGIDAASPQ